MKLMFSKLIPILLVALLAGYFTSCQEDPMGITDVNTSLPEVIAIDATADRIIAGNSVDVSIETAGDVTYQWNSEVGTFADASAANTTWSSEGVEETMNAKLVCTVTNAGGSRNASVTVIAVVPTVPVAHWTFDSDKKDAIGGLNAVGDNVTINTTDARIGAGCASFPGPAEEFDPNTVLLVEDGTDMVLGPEDDYTIMVWIKTAELGCIIYGRTFDGIWDWDADDNCKMWGFFDSYGDPAMAFITIPWTTFWFEEFPEVTDDEWHHFAAIHVGEDDSYTFYIDGEEYASGNLEYEGETSEDGETTFTIGGADYPGVLSGLMDEFKYYDEILGESEIALFADEE